MTMARHLAYLMLSCKSCLYCKWFAGDENQVADSLSRDFHLSDEQLTQMITLSLPKQVPFGFQIYPLPNEIVSWLTSLLLNQPCKEPWSKQLMQSKLSLGHASKCTSHQLSSQEVGIWTHSIATKNIRFSAPSATPSERVDFLLNKTKLINLHQFEPPSFLWHRPTSWLTDQIHNWMMTKSTMPRGYKNKDNPEQQQVAVTGSVLKEFYKLSTSQKDKSLCELFIGAFFFTMQSCKYIKVSGTRKTKLLRTSGF
jgi:hypothetical protein